MVISPLVNMTLPMARPIIIFKTNEQKYEWPAKINIANKYAKKS